MSDMQKTRKHIKCVDGFSISIQASEYNYCSPKENGYNVIYTSVELGFPNREDNLIK